MPVHIDRHSNVTQTTGRVPATLQNVFLASNRGIDVDIPPPLRVANKVFQRSLLGRTYSSDSSDDRRDKGGNLRGIKLRFWIKEVPCQPSSALDAKQADVPVAATSKDDVQPNGEANQRRKSVSGPF
jgi:hypothetical protein